MSVVVGIDAVDIGRMGRMLALSPTRFAEFAWTDAERAYCNGRNERYATRWAAKEAVMKALGMGFASLNPLDIEVVSVEDEVPAVLLHGAAARHAERQHIDCWSLSMTHENNLALAIVTGSRRARHD